VVAVGDHLGGLRVEVADEGVPNELAVGIGRTRDQIRRERGERRQATVGADLGIAATTANALRRRPRDEKSMSSFLLARARLS
jgi:hypothetical protein